MLLSIVIPCFNEEENLPLWEKEMVPVLQRANYEFELIFIDDGSSDGTMRAVEKIFSMVASAKKLIRHERNLGLGRCVTEGIEAAKGEYVIFLEADMSFPPEQIGEMLDEIISQKADCVCASPFIGGFENMKFARKAMTLLLNKILSSAISPEITSYSQLFKIYRRESVKDLKINSGSFAVNAEIVSTILKKGGKIFEIPVKMKGRRMGKSKIKFIPAIREYAKIIKNA